MSTVEDLDPRPHDDDELEAELARFAAEEAERLGLGERAQYREAIHTDFTAKQRQYTTMMVSGLSMAHDTLIGAALRGIGYKVQVLDMPDNESLQFGKEFGNRGQCSPTYFTVGHLVKSLVHLRDVEGLSTQEIIENYVFATAGACGPCRFGMYVTEYRKALRDAGFDGFRVLLFQQQGGIKQATGEDGVGLEVNPTFASALIRAMVAGDVLNLLGYRLRPYEVTAGATDAAIMESRRILCETFERTGSVVMALRRCRKLFQAIDIDRSRPKPVVSLIGEFWAMTTEGDGNYHMQRFLEQEGAEVDIQGITNWLLFMVWENRWDTLRRLELRAHDEGRKGLMGKDPVKKLAGLKAAEIAVRGIFQTFARAVGLRDYHLPDMDDIEARSRPYYDTMVRGGEAHMEVGKLVHFIEDRVNHMTVSVKPFGCMPSSGVSDGVQAIVTAEYPEAIFLPIETTGDGQVNAHSRVQMMLFKARQKARDEFQRALADAGMTEQEFRAKLARSRYRDNLKRPPHRTASVVSNLVYALG